MRSVAFICSLALLSFADAGAETLPAPLQPYAGQILYVDFWASWCGPCAQSFPWLNQMQAKYGDRLTIVGVDVDTDTVAARAFLQRNPAQFGIVEDPRGELAEHYQIKGMPSAVVLDASGRVIHQHSGFRSAQEPEYESAIRAALERTGAARGASP